MPPGLYLQKFKVPIKPVGQSCPPPLLKTENTHKRGKYHCTTDLLFDWFGFNQTSTTVANSTYAKQLNPNKINTRSAIH